MRGRERRKAGSSWLGATRNYPLDSRPDTKAWTGLRLRISDLDQRETLCTQRSEACLRVFTCENKGEESVAYNALSLARTHTVG